jgi:hypothetical protein
MSEQEIIISMRNIMLLQLVALSLTPEKAVLVRQELKKIWKTMKTPRLPKKTGPANKGKSFWEIDMTRFEP